jgi:hypothetical protein
MAPLSASRADTPYLAAIELNTWFVYTIFTIPINAQHAMDIAPGSLYRLEGWQLDKGNYDLEHYRSNDPNWTKIVFEGLFLDPNENPDANQNYGIPNYVGAVVQLCFQQNNDKSGMPCIIFVIPQDCDQIEPGPDFPSQFDDFSAYPESDYGSGRIRIFISRDDRVTDLGRYKTMEMLGTSWDEAIENHSNFFVRVNPDMCLNNVSEQECDDESLSDVPEQVAKFISAVAEAQNMKPLDRPAWYADLEAAIGAGVLSSAALAGFPDLDIIKLLDAVQASDDSAAQFILCRINTPRPLEPSEFSETELEQARAFFKLLVAVELFETPKPDWYDQIRNAKDAAALMSIANAAGYVFTMEQFREVLRWADGEIEESYADWFFMNSDRFWP